MNDKLIKSALPLLALIGLVLILNACCKPPTYTGIQDIPQLSSMPVGVSFSFLDSEGKRTTITKIDSLRAVVEQERPKRERATPFIHIGSSGKDKSETTTADNGGVVGKDKSDNKGATDSGNKSKVKTTNNSFPWYVYLMVIVGLFLFFYFKGSRIKSLFS